MSLKVNPFKVYPTHEMLSRDKMQECTRERNAKNDTS